MKNKSLCTVHWPNTALSAVPILVTSMRELGQSLLMHQALCLQGQAEIKGKLAFRTFILCKIM